MIGLNQKFGTPDEDFRFEKRSDNSRDSTNSRNLPVFNAEQSFLE